MALLGVVCDSPVVVNGLSYRADQVANDYGVAVVRTFILVRCGVPHQRLTHGIAIIRVTRNLVLMGVLMGALEQAQGSAGAGPVGVLFLVPPVVGTVGLCAFVLIITNLCGSHRPCKTRERVSSRVV